MRKIKFLAGLDLGQAQDYTALAILERQGKPADKKWADLAPKVVSYYDLPYLNRFRLGTSYPDIVQKFTELLADDTLRERTELVLDATGVGVPVVDSLRQARLQPVRAVTHVAASSAMMEGVLPGECQSTSSSAQLRSCSSRSG